MIYTRFLNQIKILIEQFLDTFKLKGLAHRLQKRGRFFSEKGYKNGYRQFHSYSSKTNFLKSCQYMKKPIILNELSKFQNVLQNLYAVGTSPLFLSFASFKWSSGHWKRKYTMYIEALFKKTFDHSRHNRDGDEHGEETLDWDTHSTHYWTCRLPNTLLHSSEHVYQLQLRRIH